MRALSIFGMSLILLAITACGDGSDTVSPTKATLDCSANDFLPHGVLFHNPYHVEDGSTKVTVVGLGIEVCLKNSLWANANKSLFQITEQLANEFDGKSDYATTEDLWQHMSTRSTVLVNEDKTLSSNLLESRSKGKFTLILFYDGD